MTNEECDLLVEVSKQPRRMMTVDALKKVPGVDWRKAAGLLRDKHVIYFHGGVIAVTDGGYDAMIDHCAHNF